MNAPTLTAPRIAAPRVAAESRRVNTTLDSHAGFARLRAAGRFIYAVLENYGEARAIRSLQLVDPALARQLIAERQARHAAAAKR